MSRSGSQEMEFRILTLAKLCRVIQSAKSTLRTLISKETHFSCTKFRRRRYFVSYFFCVLQLASLLLLFGLALFRLNNFNIEWKRQNCRNSRQLVKFFTDPVRAYQSQFTKYTHVDRIRAC